MAQLPSTGHGAFVSAAPRRRLGGWSGRISRRRWRLGATAGPLLAGSWYQSRNTSQPNAQGGGWMPQSRRQAPTRGAQQRTFDRFGPSWHLLGPSPTAGGPGAVFPARMPPMGPRLGVPAGVASDGCLPNRRARNVWAALKKRSSRLPAGSTRGSWAGTSPPVGTLGGTPACTACRG